LEYTRKVDIFVKIYNMRYLLFLLSVVLISCEKEIVLPVVPSPPTSISHEGYKVNTNAKQLGKEYWLRGTGIPNDLIIQTFQNPLVSENSFAYKHNFINGGWGGSVAGDFNLDGWVDVFTPGADPYIGLSFLLFDPKTGNYKDTTLLNDKSIITLPKAIKVVPYYMNNDNYVDLIIFAGDSDNLPVRMLISDGSGGYNYKTVNIKYNVPSSCCGLANVFVLNGDAGDLNNDGNVDLVIAADNFVFIYWGVPGPTYFNENNYTLFASDTKNFPNVVNIGTECSTCGGKINDVSIQDVNGDKNLDLITSSAEENNLKQRLIINKGNGRFSNSDVESFPLYSKQNANTSYIVEEGTGNIIAANGFGLKGKSSYWNIFIYTKVNGEYVIDRTKIEVSEKTKSLDGAKSILLYYDYNKDGIKDIGYVDASWGDELGDKNIMKYKTVFIKTGDKYVEQDFYQYDLISKNYLVILNKRFK
jgi:hypothetical protein